ncbi:MAG: phosphatase PAP2 family protein [Chloroflexi bacterium]|nr:phosphatase PAP2 family protein [Chloroflexota bacterium]
MPPDWQLSVWITSLVDNWSVLDEVGKVLASNYFAPKVAAIILVCLWFGTRNYARREYNQKVIVGVAVGTALGFIVAESLCLIQDQTGDFWNRPYLNHDEAKFAMEKLYFPLPDSSFPSNAMCGLAAIATGIGFADRRAAIAVWILVALWAFGRMYVGVHYPVDIAGGILIGATCALIGRYAVLRFDHTLSWLLAKARMFYMA